MNEAFCDVCRPLFEGAAIKADWRQTDEAATDPHRHHQLARDLRECAQTRCILCAAIWNSFERSQQNQWLKADTLVPESQAQLWLHVALTKPLSGEKAGMVMVMKYSTMPEDLFHPILLEAFDGIDDHKGVSASLPGFQPQVECASAPSSESIHWAKEMLANCEAHHEQCRVTAAPWLPTRLIHLSHPSRMPRLVEASEVLLESCTTTLPRYTTLSHCWGTSIPPLKLTQENRCQFYDEIRQDQIPKTFSDAMTVTRLLGIEYIWIDSLCIIQGDTEDWEREVTRMADVYRHGYCNMAALDATDSSLGFLYRRDPARLNPVLVELRWEHHERTLWVYTPNQCLGGFAPMIDASPVHRRAWVLQERVLSPRILHFGQGAIYWECRELIAPEAGNAVHLASISPEGGSFGSHRAADPTRLSQQEIYDLVRLWAGIVHRYTTAHLTYQSDKFVAISAVAREIHEMLSAGTDGKVEYLAGLWSVFLERELLWRSASHFDPYRPVTVTHHSPTHGVTAPSWSWASLNGPVLPSSARYLTTTTVVAHVTGHTLTPSKADDPFFGPAAGSKGVLEIKGLCWRLPSDWRNDRRSVGDGVSLLLCWDVTVRSQAVKDAANFLLPVATHDGRVTEPWSPRTDLLGLVLQRVEDSTNTASFRRVGTFVLGGENNKLEDRMEPDAVEGKGWPAWLNENIELCLEHKLFWPSQFEDGPEQSSATAPEIWAKATTHQIVYLE